MHFRENSTKRKRRYRSSRIIITPVKRDCAHLRSMPFHNTLLNLQWSKMHWISSDGEMRNALPLKDSDKRGPDGCTVLLSDLLMSLVKCVDVTAAPEGFRLAAGTSIFVMLHWDYSTLQWVLCKPRTQQYLGDEEGMGGGAWSEGGILHFLQPDNIVSTLMAHTLGGSWLEWKGFHESSIAYVQSGGEHYMAYVAIPMQSCIVMQTDLNLHEEFRVDAGAGIEDVLDWFDFDQTLGPDIVLNDFKPFDNDLSHDEPLLDNATPPNALAAPAAPDKDSIDHDDTVEDSVSETFIATSTLHTPVLSPSKPAYAGFDFFEKDGDPEKLSQANTPVAAHFRQQVPPELTKTLDFPLEPVPAPFLQAPEVAGVEDVSRNIEHTLQVLKTFKSRLAETLADCVRFQDAVAKAKHFKYKWV